jgi:Zn-dependent M28 family amino/carboxypeptidase
MVWLIVAVVVLPPLLLGIGILWMTQMPLRSFAGDLPPLSAGEAEASERLSRDLRHLSETIGERNLKKPEALEAAADYIRENLRLAGYVVAEQKYSVRDQEVSNLEVKVDGTDGQAGTIVVGAHYDSVEGAPGADDNATGVAACLELTRRFHGARPRRTLRFVFFVNEEPPYFQTYRMGSLVYAQRLKRDRVAVSAMISLETMGFYSEAPNSQAYPAPLGFFYPERGNFIGFVSNAASRGLLRRAIRRFRETTAFPSEGVAAPEGWPGIGWSDHWSFWQEGYPAIMVTDTAPFRYPYYHTSGDTPDRVDVGRMTRVVEGVGRVVESLSSE